LTVVFLLLSVVLYGLDSIVLLFYFTFYLFLFKVASSMGVMSFLAICHACELLYCIWFFCFYWVANKVLSLSLFVKTCNTWVR